MNHKHKPHTSCDRGGEGLESTGSVAPHFLRGVVGQTDHPAATDSLQQPSPLVETSCTAQPMIDHSYVHMHNGHRDRMECVYERDRVVIYRGEARWNRR